MNKNIVLDFSRYNQLDEMLQGQPIAIMPAELAKKLLRVYANSLVRTGPADIINTHIINLHEAAQEKDLNKAIRTSMEWLQERELIRNVGNNDWNAYAVESNLPKDERIIVDRPEDLAKDNTPRKYSNEEMEEMLGKTVDVRPGPAVLGKIDLTKNR